MSAQSDTQNSKVGIEQGGGRLFIKSGAALDVESGGALKIAGVDLTTQLAAMANNSARYVAAGSTLTLTAANDRQVIKLDTATGSVVTLPAATGSGVRFRFLETVLATSNSHIVKVANASDTMIGMLTALSDDAANVAKGWPASAASDTVTLNRTTTGGVTLGEWFDLEDVAANLWAVSGVLSQNGTEASPFSATV